MVEVFLWNEADRPLLGKSYSVSVAVFLCSELGLTRVLIICWLCAFTLFLQASFGRSVGLAGEWLFSSEAERRRGEKPRLATQLQLVQVPGDRRRCHAFQAAAHIRARQGRYSRGERASSRPRLGVVLFGRRNGLVASVSTRRKSREKLLLTILRGPS